MKARKSWELVALTMLIILPLIAVFAVILRPVTVDMVSVEKKQPRLVEVVNGSEETITAANLTLTWGQPFAVPYRGPEGVVTAINVSAGQQIDTGQTLYQVDAITVRAFVNEVPLFGTITKTANKAEITSLNLFLNATGLLKNPIPEKNLAKWNWQTEQGIKALAKENELADTPTEFDTSWVQWIPSNGYHIGKIVLALGADAPSNGQTIIEGQREITKSQISSNDSKPVTEGVFQIQDQSFNISGGQLSDPTDLKRISTLLNPPEESDESVKEIEIRNQTQTGTQAVPPGAILTGPNNETCVLTPIEGEEIAPTDPKNYKAHEVTITSGMPGVTNISGLPTEVNQILTNPVEIGVKSSQCGS